MVVSKQCISVAGLNLDVYGLKEYKAKQARSSKNIPVAIMFALHGFKMDKSMMEPVCRELCANTEPSQLKRHLIMVTFDHMNHGERLIGQTTQAIEPPFYSNRHSQYTDMWDFYMLVMSSTSTVSTLIGMLEVVFFGAASSTHVEQWGVIGFSVGGSAALLAAAQDPRISAVISLNGCPYMYPWSQYLLDLTPETEREYLSSRWKALTQQMSHDIVEHLSETKVYAMTGEKDQITPPKLLDYFHQSLRRSHRGREDVDWRVDIVPGGRHLLTSRMTRMAHEWTLRWLALEDEDRPAAKL